jgi:hypothetical protein
MGLWMRLERRRCVGVKKEGGLVGWRLRSLVVLFSFPLPNEPHTHTEPHTLYTKRRP